MKRKITILSFLLGVLLFCSSISKATITYTVGATGNYTTILAAYNACNTSTDYLIEIKSDYTTETLPIVLNGTNNTYRSSINTVTIRPQSGVSSLTITQTTAAKLFTIAGAAYLIIDGRAGGTGSNVLTLQNTNTAAGSRVIYFSQGANNNTVKYCTIQGSNQSTTLSDKTQAGIIYFDGSTTTNLTKNTIDNCTIRDYNGVDPTYMIVSYCSSTGNYNDMNTISNCSIYNFTRCAIELETYINKSWTITGNSFYQTASITPTGAFSFVDVKTDGTSGNTTTITGNFFGGQATACGSSAFTLGSSTYDIKIIAIDSANTTNIINGNTIANMNISTTGKFFGIVFGEYTTTVANGAAIAGNNMHDINLSNNTSTAIQFMILSNSSAKVVINSNTLGNANSNNMVSASNGSIYGIYVDGGGNYIDSLNTIQQFSLTGTGTGSAFTGIEVWSGKMDAANNTIQDITSTSTAAFPIGGIKIYSNALNQSYINNIFQNFNATSTSNVSNYIHGISLSTSDGSGSGVFSKNRLLNFTITTTGGSGNIAGVYMSSTSGNWNFYNNVINLDNGSNTNSVGVYGLYFSSTTGAINVYQNTVKIAGNVAAGTTSSAAMYDMGTSADVRTVKNNIFQNLRKGTSLGHYTISVSNTTGATYDYNYDEVADNQAKLGKWGGTSETFSGWQTAASASHDKNGTISIIANGEVSSATSSIVANAGTNLQSFVSDDILGNSRTTTPWLGAYEIDSTLLGVNNFIASNNDFIVFPSPANYNNINVAFNDFNKSENTKVQILNITGETVYAEEIISNSKSFKLNTSSKISSGVYFIKLTNNDKISVKKIIIN